VSASPALAPNAIEAATILVFFLFVIAFIDRINIGFAALTMNKALAITSQQFGLLSGIFFWGYFLFEIPSNLLLHKLGARMWIARIRHLGNSGDADGLGDNSNPSLYFALPSFGVFSGGVTNACSGVGLNAEACSRIFDCYLLFRSGGLYQPASWRCPKLDVVQREIGSDRLFQRLVPLFRGENGRPSRRISEGHDSQLQLENDRSPDLPQLRTSTKRSRRFRR
jgi:hypothetical protein